MHLDVQKVFGSLLNAKVEKKLVSIRNSINDDIVFNDICCQIVSYIKQKLLRRLIYAELQVALKVEMIINNEEYYVTSSQF